MATMHVHRPASPGYVRLDFEVSPSLLGGDDLAALRKLHAAYLSAQADVETAHDALDAAKEAKGVREAAIRDAVRNGKKVPATISDTEAEALTEVATSTLHAALRAGHTAAKAYEAGLLEHRNPLRRALRPMFHEADEKAADARRLADAAQAERASILSALNTLDDAAAASAALASGERTHRFASAISAARTRLGETAAADADLLQAEEYLLAQKGEAVVREVRDLLAELAAIRDGDRRFTTYAARAEREAAIQARLHGLGHRINH